MTRETWSRPDEPVKSVVAEAPPAAQAGPVAAPRIAAARLEMLDGDEIIQLSIKPSLWFIPLVSLRWVGVCVLLAVAVTLWMQGGWTTQGLLLFRALMGIAALRIGVATLQWASRLYVLTNRRVLRFTGVFNVDVAECRLARIARVDLHAAGYERALRLGSIRMEAEADKRPEPQPAAAPRGGFMPGPASNPPLPPAADRPARDAAPTDTTRPSLPRVLWWQDVARPQEVHEIVTRAVRKAQG